VVSDRVLVAGDTHGDGGWWEVIVGAAVEACCPVVLQLGDFGFWPGTPGGDGYLDEVDRLAEVAGIEVWWIAGNHEHWGHLGELPAGPDGRAQVRPHVWHVPNGSRWSWAGVAFGALGGARSLDGFRRDPGRTWWPGTEEPSVADLEHLGGRPLDVLVTHDVPDGGIDIDRHGVPWLPESLTRHTAPTRHLLLAATERLRPRLVLHGHWHVRHSTPLTLPGGDRVAVEGFAHNRSRSPDAYGVLRLPDLAIDPAG
jgi:hypothetical protein